MNSGEKNYIWQADDWPVWRFDWTVLSELLAQVSRSQGLLMGRLADLGLGVKDLASLAALTQEVLKTSEIEGDKIGRVHV
mgnify:FL=1